MTARIPSIVIAFLRRRETLRTDDPLLVAGAPGAGFDDAFNDFIGGMHDRANVTREVRSAANGTVVLPARNSATSIASAAKRRAATCNYANPFAPICVVL